MIRINILARLLLFLLGLASLSAVHAAIFPAKGAVLPLTGKTWKDKLKDGVSMMFLSSDHSKETDAVDLAIWTIHSSRTSP
jgi:hypothetical protein